MSFTLQKKGDSLYKTLKPEVCFPGAFQLNDTY
jgi:hypothetical protein